MVRQNVLWSTTLHFSPLLEIGMMKAKFMFSRISPVSKDFL